MKMVIDKQHREKVAQCIEKLKYRMYQADIRLASHDTEGLLETCYGIIYQCRKIHKTLKKRK